MKSINYLFLLSAFVSQAPTLSAMDVSARVESFDDMKTRHAKELADLDAEHAKRGAKFEKEQIENKRQLEEMVKNDENNGILRANAESDQEKQFAKDQFNENAADKKKLSIKIFDKENVGLVRDVASGQDVNDAFLMKQEFEKISPEIRTKTNESNMELETSRLIEAQKKELQNASKSKLSTIERTLWQKIMSFFGPDDVGPAADSIKSIVGKNSKETPLSIKDKIDIKNALKNLDGEQRVAVLDKIIRNVNDESLGISFPRREEFIEFINKILPESERVEMTRKGTHHGVALATIKN